MKHFSVLAVILFVLFAGACPSGAAIKPIKGTRHDLSYPTGTTSNYYYAANNNPSQGGTTQICVFCHTPHGGNTEAPLWNRSDSAVGSYQTYSSEVLASLGVAVENPSTGGVHVKTRICLSCHDGTVALGSVVNMPKEIDTPSTFSKIQMTSDYLNDPTRAAYIGTDLSDDHPVAVKQVTVPGTGYDPELKLPTAGSKIRLYKQSGNQIVVDNNTSGNYVECTSCHDPHDDTNGSFLRQSNQYSGICTTCHNKQIGNGQPVHDNATVGGSNASYNPNNTTAVDPKNIGDTVANVRCMNCHYSHKAGIAPGSTNANSSYGKYLLTFQEESTCFNSPTANRYGQTTNVCHATGSPNKDVQSQENPPSGGAAHNVSKSSYAGKHQAMEAVVGGTNGYGWLNITNNWHVECNDCHNPHTAGSSKHTAPGNTIGNTSPLYGVGGVSVAWTGVPKWNAPSMASQYSAFESLGLTQSTAASLPAPYAEYQICFKCHSSFAWGFGSKPTSPSLSLGGGSTMTDQAQEFNPANTYANGASAHPIAGTTGQSHGTLKAPWNATPGNQTMYCSDCHGTKDTIPAAQGPHGSNSKFGDNSPINAGFILVSDFTDTYSSTRTNAQPTDLCSVCHDPLTYITGVSDSYNRTGTGFSSANYNLHLRHALQANVYAPSKFAYRCVNCHTRVPHGYNRKAMIVVQGEGAPYEAGGAGMGKIISAPLAAPGTYADILGGGPTAIDQNCTTVAGCHH